jgi:hypothetical protein
MYATLIVATEQIRQHHAAAAAAGRARLIRRARRRTRRSDPHSAVLTGPAERRRAHLRVVA